MAKALFGHVGGAADPQLVREVQRLRRRVRELEDEVSRLQAGQDVLGELALTGISTRVEEPALT